MVGQGVAQNADIRVAMHCHGIDATLAAVDVAQRRVKRVIVHPSLGIQQGTVDIKQIGVELSPVEGVGVGHSPSLNEGNHSSTSAATHPCSARIARQDGRPTSTLALEQPARLKMASGRRGN